MSKTQKWALLIVICVAAFIGIKAQQQGNGGSSVTQSGTWTVQPGNTPNSTPWLVTPNDGSGHSTPAGDSSARSIHETVDNASIPVTQSGTWNAGLSAGTNLIGELYPYTGCGTTRVESGSPAGMAALPTSSTALFSSTTCALSITLENTSSSTAYTFTITDNAGTPVSFANGTTINPLEMRQFNFPNGFKFNAGIKWSASNAAVTGYVLGIQ